MICNNKNCSHCLVFIGPMEHKLFVGSLNKHATEQEIEEVLFTLNWEFSEGCLTDLIAVY